ncbi:winged helix-turn-helix transcriptional regulator [Nocardia terpenica]|uniref:HTH hxlR-type domain-containing protein n=1 Tax=Nocardia terpenica TaxID=455432 RepID=A0A6G9Z9H2_9NOCA|nr:winged helix-turn-helix transcriptional regulator [Nocardia terpenica]QIS22114.1 hypothetical protein F6W96_30980 [Nocardia terpenica]
MRLVRVPKAEFVATRLFVQSNGLIDRQRNAEVPHRRNEYSLTPLGRTLQEPIALLTEWAQAHGGALVDFQELTAEPDALGSGQLSVAGSNILNST